MQNNRNYILDIGRFVAILSVMLFHFYSCWADRGEHTYPYEYSYDYFSWGHLGVQFFFILTGFFIAESLNRSKSIFDFWKKKLVRLGIPLVLCSIVTFLVITILDIDSFLPASSQWKNLIVSCQLISPKVFNLLFGTNLAYINGSYWFLWVELQFLVFVSIIYFIDKKNFIRHLGIGALGVYGAWYVVRRIMENYFLTNKLGLQFSYDTMLTLKEWVWELNLPYYLFFFVFGIICSLITLQDFKKILWFVPFLVMKQLIEPLWGSSLENNILYGILIFWLLFAFIGKYIEKVGPICLFVAKLGEASYAVYLLHEFMGVLLIHNYAYLFGNQMWILPAIIIIVMFAIGYLGYKYIEQPLTQFLLKH